MNTKMKLASRFKKLKIERIMATTLKGMSLKNAIYLSSCQPFLPQQQLVYLYSKILEKKEVTDGIKVLREEE